MLEIKWTLHKCEGDFPFFIFARDVLARVCKGVDVETKKMSNNKRE